MNSDPQSVPREELSSREAEEPVELTQDQAALPEEIPAASGEEAAPPAALPMPAEAVEEAAQPVADAAEAPLPEAAEALAEAAWSVFEPADQLAESVPAAAIEEIIGQTAPAAASVFDPPVPRPADQPPPRDTQQQRPSAPPQYLEPEPRRKRPKKQRDAQPAAQQPPQVQPQYLEPEPRRKRPKKQRDVQPAAQQPPSAPPQPPQPTPPWQPPEPLRQQPLPWNPPQEQPRQPAPPWGAPPQEWMQPIDRPPAYAPMPPRGYPGQRPFPEPARKKSAGAILCAILFLLCMGAGLAFKTLAVTGSGSLLGMDLPLFNQNWLIFDWALGLGAAVMMTAGAFMNRRGFVFGLGVLFLAAFAVDNWGNYGLALLSDTVKIDAEVRDVQMYLYVAIGAFISFPLLLCGVHYICSGQGLPNGVKITMALISMIASLLLTGAFMGAWIAADGRVSSAGRSLYNHFIVSASCLFAAAFFGHAAILAHSPFKRRNNG